MAEFHQHPDGIIYVRSDYISYSATRENFVIDFGVELPELPAGADEHIYTQDKRHCFMGGGDVIDGGPMPWPEGDAIIANLDKAINSQYSRFEPYKPDLPDIATLTPAEKLSAAGLTVDELKGLLGLK